MRNSIQAGMKELGESAGVIRQITLLDALSTAEVFVDGDWVESKDQDAQGHVRLIQLADVGDGYYVNKSNRFLTSDAAKRLKCTFLEPGDVLIARMPDPLGRACIFPGDTKRAVTVVDVCIIRVDPKRMHAPWLVHCINSSEMRNQISEYVTGTTRQRISRGNLSKINIALPPLPEQRRIAAILDQADALRAKRREALAQLDNLTQSIFIEMFGDPGLNQKCWPLGKIRDILESASYGTSEKSNAQGQFPVLRMNNITRSGELDLQDLKYMDLPSKDHERYLVKAGDVLFNRTNSAELVGKTAMVPVSAPKLAYAGYLVRLRVNAENHPVYLARFLNTAYAKRMLRSMCKSIIGMANINATEIQAMQIAVPPLALQQTFAARIQSVEALKATHRAALQELDRLFASLQHRAFSGEL